MRVIKRTEFSITRRFADLKGSETKAAARCRPGLLLQVLPLGAPELVELPRELSVEYVGTVVGAADADSLPPDHQLYLITLLPVRSSPTHPGQWTSSSGMRSTICPTRFPM